MNMKNVAITASIVMFILFPSNAALAAPDDTGIWKCYTAETAGDSALRGELLAHDTILGSRLGFLGKPTALCTPAADNFPSPTASDLLACYGISERGLGVINQNFVNWPLKVYTQAVLHDYLLRKPSEVCFRVNEFSPAFPELDSYICHTAADRVRQAFVGVPLLLIDEHELRFIKTTSLSRVCLPYRGFLGEPASVPEMVYPERALSCFKHRDDPAVARQPKFPGTGRNITITPRDEFWTVSIKKHRDVCIEGDTDLSDVLQNRSKILDLQGDTYSARSTGAVVEFVTNKVKKQFIQIAIQGVKNSDGNLTSISSLVVSRFTGKKKTSSTLIQVGDDGLLQQMLVNDRLAFRFTNVRAGLVDIDIKSIDGPIAGTIEDVEFSSEWVDSLVTHLPLPEVIPPFSGSEETGPSAFKNFAAQSDSESRRQLLRSILHVAIVSTKIGMCAANVATGHLIDAYDSAVVAAAGGAIRDMSLSCLDIPNAFIDLMDVAAGYDISPPNLSDEEFRRNHLICSAGFSIGRCFDNLFVALDNLIIVSTAKLDTAFPEPVCVNCSYQCQSGDALPGCFRDGVCRLRTTVFGSC